MASQASHPTRVLVIDDRPEMRRQIARAFSDTEIGVYDISSPLGATSIIARLHADVVVVGARMALMPGSRFAKLVRNNPRLAHVKVVLLVPELPSQIDRSREFEEVDAVVVEADVDTALVRTVNRLVRRPFALTRSASVLLVDPKPARRERVQRTLSELGYVVHTHDRGDGAMAAALELRPRTVMIAGDLDDVPATALVEMMREDRTMSAAGIYLVGEQRGLDALGGMCGANGVLSAKAGVAEIRERLRNDARTA
jgi:PleD family two-component response regulator